MKNLFVIVISLSFLWACSSKDSENITNPSKETTQKEFFNSGTEDLPFVEILSVDSCLGVMGSESPNINVETFYAQKYGANAYSIRVLVNLQCPPAELPDYVEYSFSGDTLNVDIDKRNRSFDVLCSCMHWVELLIHGKIDFKYIKSNAKVYAVEKES
jgi:hypothetical protein